MLLSKAEILRLAHYEHLITLPLNVSELEKILPRVPDFCAQVDFRLNYYLTMSGGATP
jgi:hypothetical protein